MSGPLDLFDAISLYIPRSLQVGTGTTVTLPPWAIKAAMPEGTQPLTYPHGVFEILTNDPIYRGRNQKGVRSANASQTDSITFATGTLDYLLSEWDAVAITSVTGTVSGTPGHVFVANTDYTLVDADGNGAKETIRLTGGGTKPDNGTAFSVVYTHKLFSRAWANQTRIRVRCTIKAKDASVGGRHYPKEAMAFVLGESLQQQLQRKGGRALAAPPASSPTPYTEEAMGCYVTSSRVGYTDESQSMSTWQIEFLVKRHALMLDAATRAIRDVDLDTGAITWS
jgi:hypothetical protein